jgi:phosphate/sulfate permease
LCSARARYSSLPVSIFVSRIGALMGAGLAGHHADAKHRVI